MARGTALGAGLCGMVLGFLLVATPTPAAAQADMVQRARALENNARDGWQRVPDILVALNVVPGARVADVGAGDGFFTVRLARAVGPKGRVIAEDIDANALARLRVRVAEELLDNVEVLQGEPDNPHLSTGTLDAVLMVDAYHELEPLGVMLEHVRAALKPGGRLVVVDPIDPRLRGRPRREQAKVHSLESGFAALEVRAAGFDIIGLQDPFTNRGTSTEQWLMIAERRQDTERPGAPTSPNGTERSDGPRSTGSETELASPDLRTSVANLKTRLEAGAVLVLDVRDADSYVEGHIPGAILVSLDDLASRLAEFKKERRRIVAYCT
jgi:predicted methyltransferase